ncbi:MAG TPA: UDP-N-acetylmuramate dehydrogenase [Bacteroidota bacterium]|nr:UDP-N-acetylmuramate dehydrogenase [Bacteroidota bacterium]
MISVDNIRNVFQGKINLNHSLASYTSMKVGGPADYFLEPKDKADLVAIVRFFQQNNFPYMMIGRGSNMIIHDDGIRGAVISLESGLTRVALEDELVMAESGARLTKLVDFCIQNSLGGLEWAAGIPASVGGAIVMNAGAHGNEIKDSLVDVDALRGGSVVRVRKEDAGFAYRTSSFVKDVVLSGRFRLAKADKEEILKRKSELIARRNATQPLSLPNSGSMFKNPPGTFAAKLIEQAGLKGKRIGGVQISEKHSNFMVNLGDARAEDVVRLIDLARRTIYQNAGILLELEVKLVGFPEHVLEKVA